MAFLELQNVTAGYGAEPVLSDLSLAVTKGECLWIHGSNGSGKSTLLKIVAGALALSGGTILLGGMRIDTLPQVRRYQLGIGFMQQSANVFLGMSPRDFWRVVYGKRRDGFNERCEELLEMMRPLKVDFGLALERLSGGQRQLAALGAVVFNRRELLLLDEPAAGLAEEATEILYNAIRAIVADGATCLLVEHEAESAGSVCTRRISLAHGAVLCDGAPKGRVKEEMK